MGLHRDRAQPGRVGPQRGGGVDEVVAFWLVLWLVMPTDWQGQLGRLCPVSILRCGQARASGLADRLYDLDPYNAKAWPLPVASIMLDDLVAAGCTLLLVVALGRTFLDLACTFAIKFRAPRLSMFGAANRFVVATRLEAGDRRKLHPAACCCHPATTWPASGEWFERGFVTYSNAAKTELLGVGAALIAGHGAVGRTRGTRHGPKRLGTFHAQIAVAVTGIAGPGGGSADKPVGAVSRAGLRRLG